MMKTLSFAFILLSGILSAQTTLIAHKSHSGTAAGYAFADPGNFGAPSPSIIAIKKITDTSVVVKYDRWGGNREDTLYNHPLYSDPAIREDTMKVLMKQMDIEYTVAPVTEKAVENKEEQKVKPARAVEEKEHKVKPKKKHSFIWLILLGGGTFLGGMMITARKQRRNIKPALIS